MTDITELAQRMKAAAEKATPGEWWADEVKNEGCYGSGDDCVEGFTSYAIYGSDGQTLFDSLNSDAACICEEYDGEGHVAWDETAQRNAEFIALANPANVLALVGALEKAQQERENWRTSFDNERFRADKLKAYIDDMEPIRAAAEKLVRCKGRYHSEQNYRALAALFGVKTPDLPPLEHENIHYAAAAEMEIAALRQRIVGLEESNAQVIQSRDHYKRMTEEGLKQLAGSRTVTVKLPELCMGVVQDGHAVMVPYPAGHWFNKTAILEMLADAGIKVEAE